jgi:ornithine carbamoyltransferase
MSPSQDGGEVRTTAARRARELLRGDALGLRGRSLLSIADLTSVELAGILDIAAGLAAGHGAGQSVARFGHPKALALIFEKPSLRTRVTFELGMQQLGGLTTVLGPAEIGLGQRESVPDVARNLERWVDAIMARVFDHNVLIGLRDNCSIPVINGLSDREHPCQALADLQTIRAHRGPLHGVKLAWIGDGNNVLHSLLLAGAMSGMTIVAACPTGYTPDATIVAQARDLSGDAGAIRIVSAPEEAADDADVVVTDTWISMGQEEEKEQRRRDFAAYQVTVALMERAKPDAIFMHCMPAYRGFEVAPEVIDGRWSVVFDEAENRLHAQKAVLATVMGVG